MPHSNIVGHIKQKEKKMSNKIHKKVFKNSITSKVFTILGFLPILALTAIFSMFTLFPQTKVSAAPSSPTNPSLSITVDTAANIHFNATDLNNSAFKSQAFGVKVTTDCRTGYTISLSDQDEDTDLKSANPLNTTNITSIAADTAATNFTAATWGYSLDNTTFKPIAKKSAPVAIKTTSAPTSATGESTSIFLGVKSAATLPTDTYSDILEVSVVTNYVPNTATFLDGNAFSTLINTNILANTNNLRLFQKSPTPPAAVFATANVASADSELPIYLWYDPAQNAMLWWTLAEHVYANPDSTHMFYFSHLYQNRGHQIYLDLRGIDTSRVTSMHGMFFQDSTNLDYITGIDLSEFNTSNVTTMYGMFDGPSNISSLNLSTFDTSKVTDMSHMFRHKQNISSLNLSNFDTSRVTSMESMFRHMYGLTSFSLPSFNTSNVTDMAYMFEDVKNLVSLDLSSFNTANVQNMEEMFAHTAALQTIRVSNNFVTNSVTNSNNMFAYTFQLVGQNGTTYSNTNPSDKTYARVDQPGIPGYFWL